MLGKPHYIIFAVFLALVVPIKQGWAAGEAIDIPTQSWSFGGIFGQFDQAQLQRGFKFYKEVCATCHGLKFLSYRNLGQKGGPEFSEEQVKALAAEATVIDGPNDDGEMFERPGRPTDRFVSPFANDNEARVANGGALPPDLSVITKARGIPLGVPWYVEPFYWIRDIATAYQEHGANYLYALLVGYKEEAPDGVEMAEGMHYNDYFPGHQIAMPNPMSDDVVDYDDGTPQTVQQYAADVTAFLMWAAEPHLEERKRIGFRVMVYLLILTVLLYLAKKKLWSRIEH